MSGAELALGIVGCVAALDVAIKACRTVIETCSAFKNAEAEIGERSTRLLSNSLQIITQLDILRQIENQLDEQSQIVQIHVLQILNLKLNYADTKLKGLVQNESPNRDPDGRFGKALLKREKAKYVMQKSSLDKAIDEVESWQRLSFNPLWFAMMKAQTQHFDKELHFAKESNQSQGKRIITATMAARNPLRDIAHTAVFFPSEKLESAIFAEIAFSSVQLVQVDDKWRLLDSVSGLSKDTIRELAVKLKSVNPSTFGLLTCLGAVHDQHNNKSSMIFRMPEITAPPETLRAKIMASDVIHSLSDRFRLATHLARAVFSIHTFNMVHKSIQPENIILFPDPESTLGSAFLLGFERVRRGEDGTRLIGDTDWAKNLYRHPQRQGLGIRERFVMQHDIYSLGVCLLEIGLWTSFVEYTADRIPARSQAYEFPGESSNESGQPEFVKSYLLSRATKELLDLGNEDFGEESELQEDGVVVAVRFIEKVLMQLGDISV